jgi:hypothetical protein
VIEKKNRPVEGDSIYHWVVDDENPLEETRIHASLYLDRALDDFDEEPTDAAYIQLAPAYKNSRDYVICLLLRRDKTAPRPTPYRRWD